MKQAKISLAYQALARLGNVKGLPFAVMSSLYQARKALTGYWEAQEQAENRAIRELAAIGADGTLLYYDEEKGPSELKKRLNEILEAEIKMDKSPIQIAVTQETVDKLGLDPNTIATLDGFVLFTLAEPMRGEKA